MHRKLQHGVSDVPGEAGMALLRALLAGARDPVPPARLRHERGPHDAETIANALPGPWRDEPLLAVAQAVALGERSHRTSGACDRQLAAPRGPVAERQAPEAVRPLVRPRFDGRGTRQRVTGGDLTALAGRDAPPALTIIREGGLARGRGPTVPPFPAWRGRCPPQRVAGGQV